MRQIVHFLKKNVAYDLWFACWVQESLSICVCQATKSRRHRQVMVDVASNEAGDRQPSGPSRTVKLSLKARTIKNVKISGNLIFNLHFKR